MISKEQENRGGGRFEAIAGFAPSRADVVAGFLMLATLLVFFAPVVFGGKVFFFRDVCLEIVPMRWFLAHSDFMALWNPYNFFGLPAAADMGWSAFYPLNFIFLLGSTPRALSFYIILHFAIAMGFTYMLVRSMRLSVPAALTASLAFAYGGFFVSCGNQVVMLNSVAWIMPLLWAARRALDSGRLDFIIMAGIFWSLQVLGGEPGIAYLSGLVLAIFLLGSAPGRGQATSSGPVIKRCLYIGGGALLIGLALSAVQWLITLELFSWSGGVSGLGSKAAAEGALGVTELFTLLVPNYIMDPAGTDNWVLGFQTPKLPYLLSIYPGVSVLIFTLLGFSRSRQWIVFMAGGLLFIWLSLGDSGGLYWMFCRLLPGFDRLLVPGRCMYGFSIFFALLAAGGIERIKEGAGQLSALSLPAGASPGRLGIILLALATGLGIYALTQTIIPASPSSATDYYPFHLSLIHASKYRSVLMAALCIALIVRARLRPGLGVYLACAAGAVVFLDLFAAHRFVNPATATDFYSLDGHAAQRLPESATDDRVMVLESRNKRERVLGAGRDVAEFYRERRLALAPFSGLEVLVRDVSFSGASSFSDVSVWKRFIEGASADIRERLLAASGVKWLVRPGEDSVRISDALPRAFVVPKGQWFADRDSVLSAMGSSGFDPRKSVLVEGEPLDKPYRVDNIFWPMEIIRDDNHRVEVLVEGMHSGYLVLLDAYYPGWEARFRGERVPIYRANGFFRAVPVGPEGGKVEFVYRPGFFYAGLLASLIAAVFCGAILFRGRGGVLWWPLWFLVLVVLPLEEGGTSYAPVTALRILVLVMAVAWAFGRGGRGPARLFRSRLDPWIIGFWILSAVSLSMSSYFYISFYWCLNILTLILLFYFTVQFTAGDQGETRATIVIMIAVLAGAIQSMSAIFESATATGAAEAGYFNPSFLAGSLMIVSPYVLARALSALREPGSKNLLRAFGFGAVFALFALGIIASRSRAVVVWPLPLIMVGLPGIEGILISRGYASKKARRTGVLVIIGLLAAVGLSMALVPNPFRERVRTLHTDIYAFERVRIWKSGLKMIRDHPLGTGPGMFKYFSYRYKFPVDKAMAGRYERGAKTAHNEYIHLAAEMSPLAPLLLFVPVFMLILGVRRKGREGRWRSGVAGPGAGLLAASLHALFDSNLHNHSITVLCVVMAGVLVTGLWRRDGGWIIIEELGPMGKRALQAFFLIMLVAGVPGHLFLGWSYSLTLEAMEEKDPERAVVRLSDATRYAFGNAVPYKLMAGGLYVKYRNSSSGLDFLGDAIRAANVAINLNPEDPDPFRKRGEYLLDLYRESHDSSILDESESMFKQALSLSPFDVDSCRGMALLYRYKGDQDAQIEWWKKALELEPYDLVAGARLSRSLLEAGRIEEAGDEWSKLQKRMNEVSARLKNYPYAFSTPYKSRMINVDEAEIANLRLLLKQARESRQIQKSGD